jgi:hypothetical protein
MHSDLPAMGDGTSGREKVEGQSERAVMLDGMVTNKGSILITQMGDFLWDEADNLDPDSRWVYLVPGMACKMESSPHPLHALPTDFSGREKEIKNQEALAS